MSLSSRSMAATKIGTSGWRSCTAAMPSGAATSESSLMRTAPRSLSSVMACEALPPVASIGSSTRLMRSSSLPGTLA